MGVISWLIPQEKQFFVKLEKQSENVLVGVNELVELLEKYDNREERRKKIKTTCSGN